MGDAQAEIRRVIEERIAAIRAKDAGRAIACLAEDVVAFEMVPPLALPPGAARDAEGFAAWLAGFEEVEVEIRDLRIEAEARVGFAHALHHLKGRRSGGHEVSIWMRSTFAFRRNPDGWKIVHSHTSVPFYPGPEAKAALDLQP
jgi:ketosteroid isomerase-like protein